MARNIRSGRGNNSNQSGNGAFPMDRQGMNEAMNAASREYSGKNEGELMNELSSKIMEAKRDGSFTPEALQQFIRSVSPMLNQAQRQKLNEIVNRIR